MRSLRSRIILLTVVVALLAVALTTWAIASRTQDAAVNQLEDQAQVENEITEALTRVALKVDEWEEAIEFVRELAGRFDVRIALTDERGRLIVDTMPGPELPPLVSIIDPLGPFAEFGEELPEEDLVFATIECLDDLDIPYEVDVFGRLFVDEGADPADVEECFDEAFEEIGEFETAGVAEPAWLFIETDTEPPIPWTQLIVVAAVVLVLAGGAAALVGGLVARPIGRLTEATRAIRGGDLGARVGVGAPEEVRELAESFNEMASALELEDERRKQLTSDIAHELRSPVTNIIGHLDAVRDGVIEASPEHLGVVSSEADRLHRLIEDLGQLAQAEEGQTRLDLEEVDVGALVRRVADAHAPVAVDRGVKLDCDCPEVMARIDGSRVEQIVGNLLNNALQAVEQTGNVSLSVSSDADSVIIRVADDGPGIPEDLLPVIFDRFRRSDQARTPGAGGRGLGLAIARALARAHGGDITAANSESGGAEFTVTLPR